MYTIADNPEIIGWWLSSPGAWDTPLILTGILDDNICPYNFNADKAFTPIVCLKPGVQIVPDGDGFKIQ